MVGEVLVGLSLVSTFLADDGSIDHALANGALGSNPLASSLLVGNVPIKEV